MKTVLVVDDSRSARMIFIRCLKIVGYAGAEFIEAGDGREALERIEGRSDVELALIDLNMPTMDGHALAEALRARPEYAGMRVVVASSLVNDAVREKLLAAGADAVLEKPISPVALVGALGSGQGRKADGATNPIG